MLVLNRATSNSGINPKDVEERLGQPISLRIATDEALASLSANQGTRS